MDTEHAAESATVDVSGEINRATVYTVGAAKTKTTVKSPRNIDFNHFYQQQRCAGTEKALINVTGYCVV